VARAAGHEVGLAHLTDPDTALARLTSQLHTAPPNVIGWSFTTNMLGWFTRLLAAARQSAPPARHIAGGTHPTLAPQSVLAAGVDAVVQGEGELVLPPLLPHSLPSPHRRCCRVSGCRPPRPPRRSWSANSTGSPSPIVNSSHRREARRRSWRHAAARFPAAIAAITPCARWPADRAIMSVSFR